MHPAVLQILVVLKVQRDQQVLLVLVRPVVLVDPEDQLVLLYRLDQVFHLHQFVLVALVDQGCL